MAEKEVIKTILDEFFLPPMRHQANRIEYLEVEVSRLREFCKTLLQIIEYESYQVESKPKLPDYVKEHLKKCLSAR